jgi:hypothetical protein
MIRISLDSVSQQTLPPTVTFNNANNEPNAANVINETQMDSVKSQNAQSKQPRRGTK